MAYCNCNNKLHNQDLHFNKCVGEGGQFDVMFVGLGPGHEEAMSGKYFVGPAGRQLKRDILAAGLPSGSYGFENVAQYWPPKHELKKLSQAMREEGRAHLRQRIIDARPKIIVPLGEDALNELTVHSGITKWRGSKLSLAPAYEVDGADILVVPTIHPSAVLRAWDFRVLLMHDLRRISRAQRLGKESILPPARRLITRDSGEYQQAVASVMAAAHLGDTLAADIETFGGELACISFAFKPDLGVSIHKDDKDLWQPILATECPKVWHNAMYDLTFLKARCGVVPNGIQHDTQLMWHALYPELACSPAVGKSLALLASIHTDENYYKDALTSWRKVADWNAFYEYNARDSAVTIEVYNELRRMLIPDNMLDKTYRTMMELVPIYRDASIRGVKIDKRTKGKKANETKISNDALVVELRALGGGEWNTNSWQQVLKQLEKFDCFPKDTAVTTLTSELIKAPDGSQLQKFLKTLLEYRKGAKAHGTYYTFEHDKDGRLRPSWNVGGTETGRLSSSGSIIFAGDVNFQTLPKAARQFVVADFGYRLVYEDLAKAEAQVVAYLSNCKPLIEAFEAGLDVYRVVAGWMYGKEPDEVTGDERYLAKRCVLGLLYGMGAKTWMAQTNTDKGYDYITLGRTKELFSLFFNRFPEIKAYHAWVEKEITVRQELWSPFGRRRTFRKRNGQWDYHTLCEAYDYIPQTIPPDIINRGVLALEEWAPEIQLIGQIHDAWLGQVMIDEHFDERIEVIKEALTIPIRTSNIQGREIEFTIPVTVEVGSNWAPASDTNPDGMRTWTSKKNST